MTSVRQSVALSIERELSAVVSTAIQDVGSAIPTYGSLSGDQVDDVKAIAFWSFRRLLQLWVTPTVATDAADRAHFRSVGSARAYDGRPLDDVLRAYRVAIESFIRHVRVNYLDDLEPLDVADLAIAIVTAIDLVYRQIVSAYSTSRDRLVHDRGRARSELLDNLLVGRQTSPAALADRSHELGLELPGHVCLLVFRDSGDTTQMPPNSVDELTAALATHHNPLGPILITTRGEDVVALTPPMHSPDDLEGICRQLHLRGCVMHCDTVDLASAIRKATHALDTAPPHAFDRRPTLNDGDVHLLSLLAARPDADTAAVVSTILGPLVFPSNRHILQGLSAFISDGTATGAAAALHLHPQTLRYRLRRARTLSGRDPRHGWDRIALDTAIHVHQVQVRERASTPARAGAGGRPRTKNTAAQ